MHPAFVLILYSLKKKVMKNIQYLLVLVLMTLNGGLQAQVEFAEVTTLEEMEDAQKKASDQQLMLFVDVYATWCGPCKMMDQEVYTDPEVAAYMNANFISVRLDGESDYGRIYASAQELQGYPSMFIFSKNGDPVSRVVGFTPAEELIGSLKGTVEGYREIQVYQTLYQRGTIEDEEFAAYIEAVREMGNQKQAEQLSAEYMERVMGEKLTDNDMRVVAFHMDLEDSWWPEFASDHDRLSRVLGENYLLAMEKIYNASLVKAVDEDNIEMISKMANELAPLVETETDSWDLRSLPFIQYYYYTNQVEELIAWVDQRFATDRKDDHRWLYGAAAQITDMDQQYRTPALLNKEVEWFKTCLDLEEHFDYYFYHGMVLFLLQKQDEAKDSFLKAEALASTGEQKDMIGQVMSFIRQQ
jgi:thioredoxin-related protein